MCEYSAKIESDSFLGGRLWLPLEIAAQLKVWCLRGFTQLPPFRAPTKILLRNSEGAKSPAS